MNILLADDHLLFNEGMSLILKDFFRGCEIVQVNSWATAHDAIRAGEFDLALLDLFMPSVKGWNQELADIISSGQLTKSCIISASLKQDHIQQAFEAGVKGYIHKSSGLSEVKQALRLIMAGKTYFPAPLKQQFFPSKANVVSPLTQRQCKILTLIAEGMSNRQIAQQLEIKESTVKRHTYNICQQLGANNRTEAVHIARKKGLLLNQ